MNWKIFMIGMISLIAVITLSACGGTSDDEENQADTGNEETEMDIEMEDKGEKEEDADSHAHMDHSGSGDVPEGLEEAENPTFEVGSQATIQADHMAGMEGAEAEIVGAYDTTVYTVSYTPTTGEEPVENHKWVIHEEIAEAGSEPFVLGEEVILEADHMEGMEGATATIDSVEETTVYMVDFVTTTDGEEVRNHKWVTESELSGE
ncbi:YdhK family protein [Oceanobacillus salinisoli]|uniref:YdhK family protein n=1 Tax=Oceanobacillus salinisoli TaxID=2678611 RepID=UPI001E643F02|nr:YdhK family protein [Oceanobacillus salinisoli]